MSQVNAISDSEAAVTLTCEKYVTRKKSCKYWNEYIIWVHKGRLAMITLKNLEKHSVIYDSSGHCEVCFGMDLLTILMG